MARIRTIKPEFFADEKISRLKRDVRLMFIGIWVFSDDYGTVRSNPVWLKSNIFPYDEELRVNDVKLWLDTLVKARMIEPFQYNGEGFFNIRTFDAHQKVEKKSRPIVPVDEKVKILSEHSGNSRGVFGEQSETELVISSSKEEVVIVPPGTDLPREFKELEKNKKNLHEFIKNKSPDFIEPYVEFWNLFAEEKKLAAIKTVTDARKKKFSIRIKEQPFNFIEILRKAGQSEFILTGKWFGFDWVIENSTNYLKVIEGNYDNGQDKNNMLTEIKITGDRLEQAKENSKRYELQ